MPDATDAPARPDLLSIAETALALGVSPSTVKRMLRRGELEGSRVSLRSIRIRRDSIDRHLRQGSLTYGDR